MFSLIHARLSWNTVECQLPIQKDLSMKASLCLDGNPCPLPEFTCNRLLLRHCANLSGFIVDPLTQTQASRSVFKPLSSTTKRERSDLQHSNSQNRDEEQDELKKLQQSQQLTGTRQSRNNNTQKRTSRIQTGDDKAIQKQNTQERSQRVSRQHLNMRLTLKNKVFKCRLHSNGIWESFWFPINLSVNCLVNN